MSEQESQAGTHTPGPYVAGLGGAKPAVRIQFRGTLEEQRQACREWSQFLEAPQRLRAAVHAPALLEALEGTP